MSDRAPWDGATITVQGSGIHYMMRTQDSVYHSAAHYVPGVGLLKAVELPQLKARDENDQMELHTLMIRDGQKGQMFACLNCKLHYASAEDFKRAHNIAVEDESPAIEEPLWEALPIAGNDNVGVAPENEGEIITEEIAANDIAQEEYNVCIKEEEYYCLQCGLTFSTMKAAEEHACNVIANEDNAPTNQLVCGVCEAYFDSLEEFETHQTLHAECAINESLPVQIESEQVFNSIHELNAHLQKQKKIKEKQENFTCEICNITFRAERYLNGHRKIHNERPARGIEQALPANMKQDYPQSDQFYCEFCDKSFDSNLLLVHKNMHLNDEISQNTCGICNRDFYSTETYEMHMKLHAGNNLHKHAQTEQSKNNKSGRYKCQYCEKFFKRPYEKISHERVHTGEKPYSCEVCGKRFRVSYSLTMHLRTHTDVRPYECEVCHKRFKSQPVFAHHKRIHSNERSFQCDKCNKTFQTTVQLSAHRNSHSKPFVCTICKRGFAALYLLRTHMQIHQSEVTNATNLKLDKIKKCEICGTFHTCSATLRQHMMKQHGIMEILSNDLNELEEYPLLSEREEIVEQQLNNEVQNAILEPVDPVDEQSALLIAVANAAEQFENQHSIVENEQLHY